MILSSLSICGICGSLPKCHLPIANGILSGAHRSEKQLIHMLSNRAIDPKELSI